MFTEFPDLAPGQIAGRERVFESTVRQAEEEQSERNWGKDRDKDRLRVKKTKRVKHSDRNRVTGTQ